MKKNYIVRMVIGMQIKDKNRRSNCAPTKLKFTKVTGELFFGFSCKKTNRRSF